MPYPRLSSHSFRILPPLSPSPHQETAACVAVLAARNAASHRPGAYPTRALIPFPRPPQPPQKTGACAALLAALRGFPSSLETAACVALLAALRGFPSSLVRIRLETAACVAVLAALRALVARGEQKGRAEDAFESTQKFSPHPLSQETAACVAVLAVLRGFPSSLVRIRLESERGVWRARASLVAEAPDALPYNIQVRALLRRLKSKIRLESERGVWRARASLVEEPRRLTHWLTTCSVSQRCLAWPSLEQHHTSQCLQALAQAVLMFLDNTAMLLCKLESQCEGHGMRLLELKRWSEGAASMSVTGCYQSLTPCIAAWQPRPSSLNVSFCTARQPVVDGVRVLAHTHPRSGWGEGSHTHRERGGVEDVRVENKCSPHKSSFCVSQPVADGVRVLTPFVRGVEDEGWGSTEVLDVLHAAVGREGYAANSPRSLPPRSLPPRSLPPRSLLFQSIHPFPPIPHLTPVRLPSLPPASLPAQSTRPDVREAEGLIRFVLQATCAPYLHLLSSYVSPLHLLLPHCGCRRGDWTTTFAESSSFPHAPLLQPLQLPPHLPSFLSMRPLPSPPRWMQEGRLDDDIHGEFFIAACTTASTDTHTATTDAHAEPTNSTTPVTGQGEWRGAEGWEGAKVEGQRFVLRCDAVPVLFRSVADDVLATGQLVHALREHGYLKQVGGWCGWGARRWNVVPVLFQSVADDVLVTGRLVHALRQHGYLKQVGVWCVGGVQRGGMSAMRSTPFHILALVCAEGSMVGGWVHGAPCKASAWVNTPSPFSSPPFYTPKLTPSAEEAERPQMQLDSLEESVGARTQAVQQTMLDLTLNKVEPPTGAPAHRQTSAAALPGKLTCGRHGTGGGEVALCRRPVLLSSYAVLPWRRFIKCFLVPFSPPSFPQPPSLGRLPADFLSDFMALAGEELCKPASRASQARIDLSLGASLRSSTAASDPNCDRLSARLVSTDN
ncbi:unnamed protein product [Closterium sp. NIES-65]|nr:unnamed protein product [Closterium sp. NIES-65]